MKISIGTNYFGNNARQDIARQTHAHIQRKHSNVQIYNVQFADSNETWNNEQSICNLHELKKSSKEVLPSYSKKLPFVNEVFSVLSNTDCDFFVYINSDILLTDRLVSYIEKNAEHLKATTCQRLDINPISSLKETIIGERFEIAGFDAFIFNTNWYHKYGCLFEDFFLGKIYFDHAYALIIKIFGNNHKILNTSPALIAHIYHGFDSHINDEGTVHNKNVYDNSLFKNLFYIWDDYFKHFLLKRTPQGRFLREFENEAETELTFFEKHIINEKLEIEKIKAKFNL